LLSTGEKKIFLSGAQIHIPDGKNQNQCPMFLPSFVGQASLESAYDSSGRFATSAESGMAKLV